jgi:hypothetical protein
MGGSTCGKGSSGANRRPNDCIMLSNCVDVGDEKGECLGGGETNDLFCDNFVRASGDGMITCSNNVDCDAIDSECPGGDCGDCMLSQPKKCFLDPIEASGLASQDGAELVAVFCQPPVVSSGVNAAYGTPGGGRTIQDWDFTSYCPDGVTEWELGGASCP